MTAGASAMETAEENSAEDWDLSVSRFLRRNPGWLAAHPELYSCQTPPSRVHGEALADHMTAMVLHERRQAAAMLRVNRAGARMQARVQEAVLALIAAADPDECLTTEWPRILGLDSVCLCRRDGSDLSLALDAALADREILWRDAPNHAAGLYGEAAPLACYDVLIRAGAAGVLALAARERMTEDALHSHASLRFLAEAIAAKLGSL